MLNTGHWNWTAFNQRFSVENPTWSPETRTCGLHWSLWYKLWVWERAVSVYLKDMVDTPSQINYYFLLCSLMDWSQGSQSRNYFLSWCKLFAVRFALIISEHVPRALEWQASIIFPPNVIAFRLETPVILLISNDITNKLVVLRGFISLTLFNLHFHLT